MSEISNDALNKGEVSEGLKIGVGAVCTFIGSILSLFGAYTIKKTEQQPEILSHEIKYCENCGCELEPEILYCPDCGTKIS